MFSSCNDQFRRANERSLKALAKHHPDRTEEELLAALWQATGLMDIGGQARIIGAAMILLED
ncbi:MAG: hypothetical protein EOP83_23520 [Verrucomicrobiaceae bacterium]|nr:MAG: hypothetical protein EOP83_23520 [Verrucomicrobiaceae bacterium]